MDETYRCRFVGGPEDGATGRWDRRPSHFHVKVAGVCGVYVFIRHDDDGTWVFLYVEGTQSLVCDTAGCGTEPPQAG